MEQSELWAAVGCVGAVVGALALLCCGKDREDKYLLCGGVKLSVKQ